MEKHTCKLCFRRFSNGRALGGHMRSHVTTKQTPPPPPPPSSASLLQQSSSSSLPTSSSSSSGPDEDEEAERVGVAEKTMLASTGGAGGIGVGGVYGLRENPRKSFKFVDPEFSTVDYSAFIISTSGNNNTNNSASVVVQDRESETESSMPPSSSSSFRRRSRRRRRHSKPPPLPAAMEVEPVSSVSDTTPDEDVARCLMMLSRDFWSKTIDSPKLQEEEDEEEEEEEMLVVSEEEEEKGRKRSRKIVGGGGGGRSRFQCGTCKKVFRSYQALGGHRASHKKIKTCIAPTKIEEDDDGDEEEEDENEYYENHRSQIRRDELEANAGGGGHAAVDPRIHECPFCFRVFTSGQALGGHKRSHLISGSYRLPPPPIPAGKFDSVDGLKIGESLIDLNLPAPMEEEVEVELSAVSDVA